MSSIVNNNNDNVDTSINNSDPNKLKLALINCKSPSFNSIELTQKPFDPKEFFDRQFTPLEPTNPKVSDEIIILRHYAELMMFSISPTHPLRKNPEQFIVKKLVFDENVISNGKLTGKRKRGAKRLDIGSLICKIQCEQKTTIAANTTTSTTTNDSKISSSPPTMVEFKIHSPLVGTVIDVNSSLQKDPSPLQGISKSIGDDWLVVLGKNWMTMRENQAQLVAKIKSQDNKKQIIMEDQDED